MSQCVHYFEWKTYSACKNDKFKPQKEVGGGMSDKCRRGFATCNKRVDSEVMRGTQSVN